MKQPRIYAVVKRPDGTIAKVPIQPSASTAKAERRMIKDAASGLWLYRNRYEYKDRKQQDEAS